MENGKKLNHLALWPALALLAVLIGFGVFKTEALGSLLTTILYGMADKGGWFFCCSPSWPSSSLSFWP